ncbi:hypothetical protein [Alkalihalobacillus trypoxylicola]|uniref:Uncharacterized protein n=1 Tax=Alkalihalobacillus trypoxylicola TaxID=519424 RepID=A0A162EA64_9BACI|nr:hypothetical protein [Alkalihalobacillus trypoxylicola]KYG32139.1 hypothetical protein AZF04_05050 [Alkalihalobacillus trypoxylicola]
MDKVKFASIFGTIGIIIFLIVGFTVPLIAESNPNNRVIIDNTLGEYSAPACFDEAGFTNNIDEMILKDAIEYDFVPESSCTESELPFEKKPLFLVWFS